MIQVNESEIDNLNKECLEIIDEQDSKFKGMTYEQGIIDTINWIQGNGEYPLSD